MRYRFEICFVKLLPEEVNRLKISTLHTLVSRLAMINDEAQTEGSERRR